MFVSLDVGGTKTAIAISKSLDDIKLEAKSVTKNINNFEQDFNQIVSEIHSLVGNEKVEGIGVGLPGLINAEKTGTGMSANLSSWENKNVKELLQKEFSTKAFIGHDVGNGALGEYMYGAGNKSNFTFLIWGTGIGATNVVNNNGKVDLENIEAGFQVIKFENDFKYLESIAGGGGIKNTFGKDAESLSEDEWGEVCKYVAMGIINLTAIRNTNLIVLSGGIANKQSHRIQTIQDQVNEYFEEVKMPTSKLLLGKLGEDSGLYGGFALVKLNI